VKRHLRKLRTGWFVIPETDTSVEYMWPPRLHTIKDVIVHPWRVDFGVHDWR
jgi:hypothetical protein